MHSKHPGKAEWKWKWFLQSALSLSIVSFFKVCNSEGFWVAASFAFIPSGCSYIIFIPSKACLLILALSCGLSVPLQELHTPRFMLFPPHPEVSKPFCLNMLICSVREEAVPPSWGWTWLSCLKKHTEMGNEVFRKTPHCEMIILFCGYFSIHSCDHQSDYLFIWLTFITN